MGVETIMVVVDRLTKYAHFIGLKHSFMAYSVATFFIKEIVRLHGFPLSIVCDRDQIFLSIFWKELFCLRGTTLLRSTFYHPQTHKQSEIVNQTLVTYFRCYVNEQPRQWAKWLPWAEFCYNSSPHSSSNLTPCQALYDRDLCPLIPFSHGLTVAQMLIAFNKCWTVWRTRMQ